MGQDKNVKSSQLGVNYDMATYNSYYKLDGLSDRLQNDTVAICGTFGGDFHLMVGDF